MWTAYFTGLMSCLVLIAAIGTQNAFILRQGIRGEHVLPLVAFCVTADAILIGAGIAGLGVVIEAWPQALVVATWAGAVFMFVYGGKAALRALNDSSMEVDGSQGTGLKAALLACAGFTFLNPHVYLDTVILLGALGNQAGEGGRWLFWLGACTASLTWFVLLGYGARLLAPFFRRAFAWRVLDSFVALTMIAMGIGLVANR
ncbi:LysE/ArgO family amino acid transporter [Burkholderiaceae bacterium DAT-1]|nr:LysE/ArgO family amino acid transporter [Burkholderiaceae bacterium DAT-1]